MSRKLAPLVPGVFTVGNFLCGFLSIMHCMTGKYINAAWLIILGALFDLLDGKVARLTRGTSEMGVQLDSFADFLTFAIAPGIMLFSMGIYSLKNWKFIIPILFLLAGAFRLARYNITTLADPMRRKFFQGLPIPLAAVCLAGFTIFSFDVWGEMRYEGFFTPAIVLLSWLMISNVQYPAGFGFLHLTTHRWRIALLSVPFLAILIKPKWFIFPFIAAYICHGFIREIVWIVRRVDREESDDVSY